ncbi:hypothetical protein HY251_01300 [bacterium]|nr:hypothetical protein [bacterium]
MTDYEGAPGAAAPPPYDAQQPKSHCLRNCLIVGCLLVVLGVVGTFFTLYWVGSKFMSSFVQGPGATTIAQSVAKGAVPPPGYELVGVDFNMFGYKAKGFLAAPKGGSKGLLLACGAWEPKPKDVEETRAGIEKAIQSSPQAGRGGSGGQTIVEQGTEEFEIGTEGEKVKAFRLLVEDQRKQRLLEYVILLDSFDNEFGYLAIAALAPDDGQGTDPQELKDFLKTINVKKKPDGPKKDEKTGGEKPGDDKK